MLFERSEFIECFEKIWFRPPSQDVFGITFFFDPREDYFFDQREDYFFDQQRTNKSFESVIH